MQLVPFIVRVSSCGQLFHLVISSAWPWISGEDVKE